ncbi:uncharacterized protein LOC141633332 isoform X3 [Silene latifolia]|uniref:uncharacterized protein LOC141633332 isoform X3 n=1 Tax=Silene latifolia TaxID=37657 RepID=UPI003D7735FB
MWVWVVVIEEGRRCDSGVSVMAADILWVEWWVVTIMGGGWCCVGDEKVAWQVNDEIEANIQITRQIESKIVKCEEIEATLAARESEVMKLVYFSMFELRGLIAVTGSVTLVLMVVQQLGLCV